MDQGLTERTVGGLLWVGVGKAAGAVLRLLVLVVLARLLSPGDFGVMSAALIVIGLALIFSQLGLGPAIVQRAKLETRHLQTAFTASVALGVALGGLVWWSAPATARFFTDVAGLEPVLRALAWLFPLGGLSVVAASLLQRELRFRLLATVDVVTFAVGYGVVGVTLAALGFGVWALVWAQLAQSALNSAILLAARPPRLRALPDRRALAELLYFGGGVTAAKVAHYVALQADNVLVGRWLGAEALGLYGRAREFAAAPAQLLGEGLDRVLFPAMAQVQADTRRLAPAFRRGVALIALVMLPLSGVLFVLAPELIAVILGPQWLRVIAPFQILALGMFLQTSYRISDALARATGAVYSRAWRQVAFAALVGLGAWVGSDWGIAGVAAGMLAALAANFLLMAQLSLRLLGLKWRRFWDAHRPALYSAVATGAVAWALREVLRGTTTAPPVVLAVTLAGALGCALLLARTGPRLFLGPDGRWLLDTIRTYARTVRRSPGHPVAVPLNDRPLEHPRV